MPAGVAAVAMEEAAREAMPTSSIALFDSRPPRSPRLPASVAAEADIAAVERVEEIAQVPGIDGFFIGPADLALSLGLPPGADISEPRHVAACQRVLAAARSRGLVAGIACSGPEEARRRIAEGFNFNPIGSDIGFIAGGAQRAIRLFQTGAA